MKASILFIILYARLAYTQVSGCQEDVDCDFNSYCDVSTYQCHPCLNCEELKRAPGTVVSGCIKSVVRCGGCFNGLVEDPSGDVTAPCVSPSQSSGPGSTPPYVWVTVVVVLLLVIIMLAIFVYVYKHPDTIKLISSSRTWVRPTAPPPEPGPPPPYNPTSPFTPFTPEPPELHTYVQDETGDSSRPFIKVDENGALHNDRVRDSNQAARVFNNPHYVRGPELPPSYDAAWKDEVATPTPEVNDETTMESLWTPSQDDTPNINTPSHSVVISEPMPSPLPGPDLSLLLSEARETRLVRPPRPDLQDMQPTPSKLICVRQDTNNNGNSRNRDAGEGPSSSSQVPSVTFNITVQQHNDLKLIST